MEQGVWQEIELLYQKFQKLGISESVDYDKYYLYSLITHSTAIEGSTLTELDATVFLFFLLQFFPSVCGVSTFESSVVCVSVQ